jgi:hypothetical protein
LALPCPALGNIGIKIRLPFCDLPLPSTALATPPPVGPRGGQRRADLADIIAKRRVIPHRKKPGQLRMNGYWLLIVIHQARSGARLQG